MQTVDPSLGEPAPDQVAEGRHVARRTLLDAVQACARSYGVLADHLPELVAVRAGLKRALQVTLVARQDVALEHRRIDRLCRAAGLRWIHFRSHGEHKVLISRDDIDPPGRRDAENKDNRFSYPSCCVKAFLEKSDNYYLLRGLGELLTHGSAYPFRLNPFLVSTPFHLLRHRPCSFACTETLAATGELYAVLERGYPPIARAIVRWNRRPVFFTDICGIGILFDGELVEDRIRYRDFFYVGRPRELASASPRNAPEDFALFSDLVGALDRGDAITLAHDTVTVSKDTRTVRRLTRPQPLTWLLVDFV